MQSLRRSSRVKEGQIKKKKEERISKFISWGLHPSTAKSIYESEIKEEAAWKIICYLRKKLPTYRLKRKITIYANLHIRKGLPLEVLDKICLNKTYSNK